MTKPRKILPSNYRANVYGLVCVYVASSETSSVSNERLSLTITVTLSSLGQQKRAAQGV